MWVPKRVPAQHPMCLLTRVLISSTDATRIKLTERKSHLLMVVCCQRAPPSTSPLFVHLHADRNSCPCTDPSRHLFICLFKHLTFTPTHLPILTFPCSSADKAVAPWKCLKAKYAIPLWRAKCSSHWLNKALYVCIIKILSHHFRVDRIIDTLSGRHSSSKAWRAARSLLLRSVTWSGDSFPAWHFMIPFPEMQVITQVLYQKRNTAFAQKPISIGGE